MPIVTFDYDHHKDAWSWVVIAKDKNIFGTSWKQNNSHVPTELLTQIQKVDFSQAIIITERYLKTDPNRVGKEKLIKEKLKALENKWKPVANNFFSTLSTVTDKPIYSQKFECFMTTGYMCPYNDTEGWFTISYQHSIPSSITTICHEILHFQFLHHYKTYLVKKGMNNAQIDILKESLTFLLNEPHFNDIISSEDYGYQEHLKIRKELKNIWLQTKNFQKLLDIAVPLLKNMP